MAVKSFIALAPGVDLECILISNCVYLMHTNTAYFNIPSNLLKFPPYLQKLGLDVNVNKSQTH
jgi:hypothetical protein